MGLASLGRCPSQWELVSGGWGTSIFFGVKLMFVVVIFFGHVQLLRFVVVKIFRSCSNPDFVHIYLIM